MTSIILSALRKCLLSATVILLAGGCGSGSTATADKSSGKITFQKPFSGDYLNSAPFDHDLPLSFEGGGGNDYILTWWGGRIYGIWNGHRGHDWLLPSGTPVLAVADGEVVFAEAEPPFECGDLGMVSALVVTVRHSALDGDTFDTQYAHFNRIDVKKGDLVKSGQQLGISGMTGCTNGAHLHFEVIRRSGTNNGNPVRIDPFGWAAGHPDPWALNANGAASVRLWKEGQVPDDGKRIEEVWGAGILR